MKMTHDIDPRDKIWKEIGKIDNVRIYNNQVLIAIYERPEKTASGIFTTQQYRDEDKWQGKVGLVVKKGPTAFVDDEGKWFQQQNIKVGDWVVFRPSDGWPLTVNGKMCRMLEDINLKGDIDHPDDVW
jgi:co-chaperonin GroES (HSP10)